MTRHRVALHRFMPYGAPDLIASGSETQARALLGALALWALVFAIVLGAVALRPHRASVPLRTTTVWVLPPPPQPIPFVAPEHPPLARPPQVTPVHPSRFVAVPLAPPTPPEVAPGSADGATGREPGTETAAPPDVPVAEMPDDHPIPGVWVIHDLEPEIEHAVVPNYPEIALDARVEGTVLLQVLVGRDGKVSDVIVRGGDPMLRDAAIAAARATRFRPASANGHPVAVWVMMPFRFTLH